MEQVLPKKAAVFKPPQQMGLLWPSARRRVVHAPQIRTSGGPLIMPNLASTPDRAKVSIKRGRARASPRALWVTKA